MDEFLENIGVDESTLHVTARVNDQETIKNFVAGGLGMSIISARSAKNFIDEKRLLSFELPDYIKQRNLYIAYPGNFMMHSYVREFVDFVLKYYK